VACWSPRTGCRFLFRKHLKATSAIFPALFRTTSPYLCTQPCYFGGPFALNWGSDDRSPLDVSAASLERRMARRRIAPAFALPGYVAGAITQAFKRRADPDA
jgi:spermidine synthase